jgi:WhiB family transcriptional regulator, redox-sensing transcriptional regulator
MLTFMTAATATTGEAADEASAPTRQRQVRHLATEIDALRWQEAGACRDADLRLFFSPDGDEESGVEPAAERRRRLRKAIRICEQCPVRQVCRRYALENGEKFGVWGGLTETERRRIRSQAHERAHDAERFGEAA